MHQEKQKVLNIEEVKKYWDNMSDLYPQFDCSPQSFYFALINMLHLHNAKNVLEIGCGRCILVPYSLELLNQNATYLATDLSPKMIELAQNKIKSSIKKFGSDLSYQQWCKKNNLQIKVANGEEPLQTNIKFDRIICNMVLMLTQTPQKMLQNLYNHAQQGCLLGISVWGQRQLNLFMQQLSRVIKQLNVQTPKSRSNFHLYNKVQQLAEKVGWKLVVVWEQVTTLPYLDAKQTSDWAKNATNGLSYLTEQQRNWVYQQFMRRQTQRLNQKKQALLFPAQLYVFRK